ncbi:cadherin EGF LAG seven-pass G-type receptor 2-like, partial [Branchiostoma lanceolatum]|uniref:cadherin EGF LAG seven-pass G-type receptor 2-like n=1 Tax=Branchiostoma lanceolatum TaxID=7740 RepID=UPI003453778D
PGTGQVKIAGELDRETKDFYQLEISASDGSNPPKVTSGFYLNITVEDVNDNTPTFSESSYALTVQEETETGTVVGNITAEDLDMSANARIRYTFTEAVEHFAISETTGTLTVLSILDFDNATHPKLSSFTVQASDGTFSSTVEVQVSLMDINDNAPTYRADNYDTTLLYLIHPAFVTVVDATDRDSGTNSEISYSFVNDSSMTTLFDIDQSTGIIWLESDPGDIEAVNLTVAAADNGNPSKNTTTTILIEINKPPTGAYRVSFNGTTFEGGVEENSNIEQLVTSLTANVLGTGLMPCQEKLRYKLAARSDDFEFTVNDTTGEIRTRGIVFDRETRGSYTFAVVVENTCPDLDEKSFDYTSVVVRVADQNDERPTFNSSSYSFEASENITGVEAEDMGVPPLNSTCTVHVRVLDINDNAPKFADPDYRTELPEDLPIFTQLDITISASDDDTGTNGNIGFSLHGLGSHLFSIEGVSGVVSLAGNLDYENKTQYNLTVTATDNGHPNKASTSVPLFIEVTDANDNPPIFDCDDYNSSTYRDVPTTDVLVTVSATDRDSGLNKELLYSITGLYGIQPARGTVMETLFNITSSTGEIRVTTDFINDDIQQYELIITATDMGNPPLSSTTTVVIDVASSNFAPEFLDIPAVSPVQEDNNANGMPSTWNPIIVQATDNDTEDEGQVKFVLPGHNNISELFRIDRTVYDNAREVFSAEILQNAPLDREKYPSGLNITVLAVDQGATPKTSTAMIHITLTDVNDNPPTLVNLVESVAIPQPVSVSNNCRTRLRNEHQPDRP